MAPPHKNLTKKASDQLNSTPTSNAQKPGDASHCHTCKQQVLDQDKAVYCDYCKQWAHARCLKMDDAKYSALQLLRDQKYFCPATCLPAVDRMLMFERRLEQMEARFQELTSKMNILTSDSISNGSDFPVLPSKPFNSQKLIETMESVYEAQSKRRNAVLFGLADTIDDLKAVRALVATDPANPDEADLPTVCPTDIQYVFRDGPSNPDGKSRFLKVVCATSKVKDNFINIVNKRARAINPPSGLRARIDLTYQQRVDGRNLRLKLNDFDTNSHFIDYRKKCIVTKVTRKTVFSLNHV